MPRILGECRLLFVHGSSRCTWFVRLSDNRPIIAIDRRYICLYLDWAHVASIGETGQVPTVEVPRHGLAPWRGRLNPLFCCFRTFLQAKPLRVMRFWLLANVPNVQLDGASNRHSGVTLLGVAIISNLRCHDQGHSGSNFAHPMPVHGRQTYAAVSNRI